MATLLAGMLCSALLACHRTVAERTNPPVNCFFAGGMPLSAAIPTVEGLTEAMALTAAKTGVRITLVEPGAVSTHLLERSQQLVKVRR